MHMDDSLLPSLPITGHSVTLRSICVVLFFFCLSSSPVNCEWRRSLHSQHNVDTNSFHSPLLELSIRDSHSDSRPLPLIYMFTQRRGDLLRVTYQLQYKGRMSADRLNGVDGLCHRSVYHYQPLIFANFHPSVLVLSNVLNQ